MKYKFSMKETAGVLAVGLVASEVARRIANAQGSKHAHQAAMLTGGTALYFGGVYIGSNRPVGGFLADGSYNRKGSCGSCGSKNMDSSNTCNDCGTQECKDCDSIQIVEGTCIQCGCENN